MSAILNSKRTKPQIANGSRVILSIGVWFRLLRRYVTRCCLTLTYLKRQYCPPSLTVPPLGRDSVAILSNLKTRWLEGECIPGCSNHSPGRDMETVSAITTIGYPATIGRNGDLFKCADCCSRLSERSEFNWPPT